MRSFLRVVASLVVVCGGLPGASPGDASARINAPEGGSLIDAVKSGNVQAVNLALRQHGDPNEAEADGTTPILRAVQEGRADILAALIAAGANVNARNNFGISPLALSLTNGSPAMTLQLLKAGADPKVPVPEAGNALLAAARTGESEVLTALIKAGMNVNEAEPKTRQTALMWAAAEGHEPAVRTLLAAGADIKARSSRNESPLFFAVRKGDIGVVDALLGAGADVNERADPAAGNRQGAGATPLDPAVKGDSMLVVSIMNAHFALADFLLKKGADPNAVGARWTALHALSRIRDYEEMQYPPPIIRPNDMDSLELGKSLLAHGANPNIRGRTTVARRDGGDQNYKDLIGATPFFLAAKSGDVPYMRLLLAGGADPNIPIDDHTTPLMVAAGIGCVPGQWIEQERDVLAAVKMLVEELHADVNAVNDDNETAVQGGVCRNADSVIQYLVDKGAKLNIKNMDGQTALDEAVDGINRSDRMKGPRIIIFHSPEHTISLVKKLTEEQRAAESASARR